MNHRRIIISLILLSCISQNANSGISSEISNFFSKHSTITSGFVGLVTVEAAARVIDKIEDETIKNAVIIVAGLVSGYYVYKTTKNFLDGNKNQKETTNNLLNLNK